MSKLSITLSPITLNYPVAIINGYTSQVTSVLYATGNMLISDERSSL